jgi:hypothetical protein
MLLAIYVAAVLTFYAMNNITLNKKKIYRYVGDHTDTSRPSLPHRRDPGFWMAVISDCVV